MLRGGADRRQAEARRLRLLALLVFFLGTAMAGQGSGPGPRFGPCGPTTSPWPTPRRGATGTRCPRPCSTGATSPFPPRPGPVGHLQRIEQCGDRVCATSGGVVHDMRADGTVERGVHDVTPNGDPITVVAT